MSPTRIFINFTECRRVLAWASRYARKIVLYLFASLRWTLNFVLSAQSEQNERMKRTQKERRSINWSVSKRSCGGSTMMGKKNTNGKKQGEKKKWEPAHAFETKCTSQHGRNAIGPETDASSPTQAHTSIARVQPNPRHANLAERRKISLNTAIGETCGAKRVRHFLFVLLRRAGMCDCYLSPILFQCRHSATSGKRIRCTDMFINTIWTTVWRRCCCSLPHPCGAICRVWAMGMNYRESEACERLSVYWSGFSIAIAKRQRE